MTTQTVENGTWLRDAERTHAAAVWQLSRSAADRSRLACVDLLRGAAMILMALDHTRDFFTDSRFAPEDLAHTTGALFFTRWITHFCAPIFFLLAGTGAYLALSRGKSLPEVSKFLWTRGLWLVFLDMTVVGFGWTSIFPFLFGGVLWSLGWSMVAMAALIRLPLRLIGTFGAAVVLTSDLLDRVNPAFFGKFAGLWVIVHGHGVFWIEPNKIPFFVLWPLVPWVGVMALGYVLGSLLGRSDWRRIIFGIGAAMTATFFFLRFFHLFGVAGEQWQVQPSATVTIMWFLDIRKYPASLRFLLMTLGPSLMTLAWLGKISTKHRLTKIVAVFGQVPLFYYVIHIYVIRTLAVYTAMLFKQKAAWLLYGGFMVQPRPVGYGHSLPFIYGMWFAVVLFMYPLCKGFLKIKQQHPNWWWLRYL